MPNKDVVALLALLEQHDDLLEAINSLAIAGMATLKRFAPDVHHLAPQAEIVRNASLRSLDQVREQMAQSLIADLWGLLGALQIVAQQAKLAQPAKEGSDER